MELEPVHISLILLLNEVSMSDTSCNKSHKVLIINEMKYNNNKIELLYISLTLSVNHMSFNHLSIQADLRNKNKLCTKVNNSLQLNKCRDTTNEI